MKSFASLSFTITASALLAGLVAFAPAPAFACDGEKCACGAECPNKAGDKAGSCAGEAKDGEKKPCSCAEKAGADGAKAEGGCSDHAKAAEVPASGKAVAKAEGAEAPAGGCKHDAH